MADNDLKETLSLINQSLIQITKELIEAGDRQAKELIEAGDRQTKVNKKILDRLEGRESNRMGRIAESVVANMIAWFMNKHFGINTNSVFRKVKIELRNLDKKSDIDVLAIGDQVIVVIEVKTTINKDHITDFSKKVVRNFANVKLTDKRDIQLPNLKKKKLCGGVAFIGVAKDLTEETIISAAEKHGLFANCMCKHQPWWCHVSSPHQLPAPSHSKWCK